MKHKIILSAFLLTSLFASAQLKVYSTGNVYVGNTTTTPNSVLSIGSAGNSLWEVNVTASSTSNASVGLNSYGYVAIGANKTYGIVGYDSAANSSGGYAIGVLGQAYKINTASTGRHYGVKGLAGNASSGYNYGVYGTLYGSSYGAGVYGTIGGTDPAIAAQYAGFFTGCPKGC